MSEFKDYPLVDSELTRGYVFTSIFIKSKYYDSTQIYHFGGIEFIGALTAILLGYWWIYRIFYLYIFPYYFNRDLD